MKLTWLGHACFLLEQDGYRIIVDPYTGVEGYPDLKVEAHSIYCSHGHGDHNAVECVKLLAAQGNPFAVRTVDTFHDDRNGALRGKNKIHVFTAGGVSVAHLGDLGHQLTAQQLKELGKVDVVLTPVGGTYTVDAAGAKAVCDAIGAKCVVPMHYRHGSFGLRVVTGVEPFAALWENVITEDTASLEVTAETVGVHILQFDK